MANPLAMLRHHQWIILAGCAAVAIVTFTVGPIILDYQQANQKGGSGGPDEVLATWKFGSIRRSDIADFRARHNLAIRYLDEIVARTQRAKATPRGVGVTRDRMGQVIDPGIPRADQTPQIISTMILAKKAESMGLMVNNDIITDFLAELCNDVLGPADREAIHKQTIAQYMSVPQLFDQLRIELLAQQARFLSTPGTIALTPAALWDYHNRLHRRVKIELVPLTVDDYVGQVKTEPSDSQIQALYTQYKDNFPHPESPEPGFKRRKLASFEFVRVDYSKIRAEESAKVKPNVTDKEIDDYYQTNKSQFIVRDEPASDQPGEKEPDGEAKKPEETDQKPEEKADAKPEEKAKETPEKKDEKGDEKAPCTDESTEKDDAKSKVDEPKDEKPAEKPAAKPEDPPAKKADEPKKDASAAKDPPAEKEGEKKEETPKDESDPKAKEPGEKKGDEKKGDEPKTEETKPEDEKTEDKKPDKKEPVYKPLDDTLRDEIRNKVADQQAAKPAQDRMEKAFAAVRQRVQDFNREFVTWEAVKNIRKDKQKPVKPDFEKLARDNGLEFGEIPMVDALSVQSHELGTATNFTFDRGFQQITFAEIGFADNFPRYSPERITARLDMNYLFWKTEEKEGFVPKLDECKAEVVLAWKRSEALGLARKRAEELVEEARKAEKSLKETFAGQEAIKVFDSPEFSWLSTGSMAFGSGMPSISAVENVVAPGNDFMRAVFALKTGESGIAVNEPKSAVYIVRLTSDSPDAETRKSEFLDSHRNMQTEMVAGSEIRQIVFDWYQDLEKEYQFAWTGVGKEESMR